MQDWKTRDLKSMESLTKHKCRNNEFAFELPSVILARHSEHFLIKYKACDNAFCKSV